VCLRSEWAILLADRLSAGIVMQSRPSPRSVVVESQKHHERRGDTPTLAGCLSCDYLPFFRITTTSCP